MKPTDEAKRLRDEINGIIADMVCDNQSSELTEEIINKVLDAVINVGDFLPYSNPVEGQQTAYNQAILDYKEDISQLRP